MKLKNNRRLEKEKRKAKQLLNILAFCLLCERVVQEMKANLSIKKKRTL